MPEIFYKRLNILLDRKTIGRVDLAKSVLQRSYPYFLRMLSGESLPDGEVIVKLCQFYKVSADWLLGADTWAK